jgi:hypothetical protein
MDCASGVGVRGGPFLEQQQYAAVTCRHRTQSRLVGDAFLLIGVDRLKAEYAPIEIRPIVSGVRRRATFQGFRSLAVGWK